jgi:hypothetical protein
MLLAEVGKHTLADEANIVWPPRKGYQTVVVSRPIHKLIRFLMYDVLAVTLNMKTEKVVFCWRTKSDADPG